MHFAILGHLVLDIIKRLHSSRCNIFVLYLYKVHSSGMHTFQVSVAQEIRNAPKQNVLKPEP